MSNIESPDQDELNIQQNDTGQNPDELNEQDYREDQQIYTDNGQVSHSQQQQLNEYIEDGGQDGGQYDLMQQQVQFQQDQNQDMSLYQNFQPQTYINNVGVLINSLNQNRLEYAKCNNYDNAEQELASIQTIREQAQVKIQLNLQNKHLFEGQQVEEFNRQEFEEFTYSWEQKLSQIRFQITNQIERQKGNHQIQMQELQVYLQSTMPTKYKPSSDLLNLRKIEQVLSKQKNYTEAKRVQKEVGGLEKKEHNKFMKERNDKILTKLTHMRNIQIQEMRALEIKLDRIYKENDVIRKQQQAEIIQKFINLKSNLTQRQRVEESKLGNNLKIKSFASQIVGKIDGSLKSNEYMNN